MNSKNKQQEKGILILLRLCTFLLAAVSFWATAQGMQQYTFPTTWQAYAASLGIQGLLLGLNFSLPSFWKKSQKLRQKLILASLTTVILFCSSWFSYLYIAGQAYGQSWDVECRLLAQEIYRNELFSADEYAGQYAEEIEMALSDQVVDLYKKAAAMGTGDIDVAQNLDLDADLEEYAPDGSAAREIMRTIISSIRPALEPNAPQDVRQLASDTLDAMQTTMRNEIASLDTRIVDADDRVSTATNSLTRAQDKLTSVPDNIDITPFQEAANIAAEEYRRAYEQRSNLVRQREDYQSVLQRTGYYAGLLGMSQNGVSTYFVGTNLREIQRELFGSTPNSELMLKLATEVFARLQSGIDLGSGETESPEYQQFLSEMNQFVKNIENYRTIKISHAELQELITQLSDGKILAIDGRTQPDNISQLSNAPDDATISNSLEPDTTEQPGEHDDESILGIESASVESEFVDEVSTNDVSSPDAAPSSNKTDDKSGSTTDDAQTWEVVWLEQFNTLKSKISSLPSYSQNGTDIEGEQRSVLYFDRAASTKRLDDGIRNYLTSHNPAQQGIIYLFSPYWTIAAFSLCVAFLLDISAFITGVIIDRVETAHEENASNQDKETENISSTYTSVISAFASETSSGLNRYVFLTGDYQCVNEIMTYKAIEQGEILEIEYSGNTLQSDFYVWDGKVATSLSPTKLLFKGSNGGPQDGVYENCILHYETPVLLITQNGSTTFLGHADPQTPVYYITKDQYEVFPANKIDNTHGTKVVIALDKNGKIIVGIYIIN